MFCFLACNGHAAPFVGAGVHAVVFEDRETEEVDAGVLLFVGSLGHFEGFAFDGYIAERGIRSRESLCGRISTISATEEDIGLYKEKEPNSPFEPSFEVMTLLKIDGLRLAPISWAC